MRDPWILGYSSSHNGAVCLLKGEQIVAAVQEERLTGLKRARLTRLDESLAFRYCLDVAGIEPNDLDLIVGAYFSGDLQSGTNVVRQGWRGQFMTIPHHFAHATAAFALSGFDEAAVLIIDGQGGLADFLPESELVNVKHSRVPNLRRPAETISIYRADRNGCYCLEKHLGEWMPNMASARRGQPMQTFGSLGGMYSAASHQIFGDAMDAGKVMGLAAFGEHRYPTSDFFSVEDDGSFSFGGRIPQSYANTAHWPDDRTHNEDLATSVQSALEDGVFYLVEHARELCDSTKLCYAGGVALNAVANEKIVQRAWFDDVYIMAAAEDSGTAIGAAYFGLWQLTKSKPSRRSKSDSVGRVYTRDSIDQALQNTPCVEVVDTDDPIEAVADLIGAGRIIGWFSGGSEIGPRALGQRSILSDARTADAKERLNARVKHREAFRPFAPLVLDSETRNWFEVPPIAPHSPLMLRTFPFLEDAKNKVPAVVHEDGTGRLQTLTPDANPKLHEVLTRYFRKTGVPIIVNTSLNVMGEPIVETPEDALWCLLYTDLDFCFLEGRLVRRSADFTSILDLCPRVVATGYSIESPVNRGRLHFGLEAQSVIRLHVQTPWGISRPVLPHIALPILQMADGRRTGRQILQDTARDTGLDETSFGGILRHLRRAQVLCFDASQ